MQYATYILNPPSPGLLGFINLSYYFADLMLKSKVRLSKIRKW